MYIKNLLYHRHTLELLLGKSQYNDLNTPFIKFDEELMKWWTIPYGMFVDEISTIEDVKSVINIRNRQKKINSL